MNSYITELTPEHCQTGRKNLGLKPLSGSYPGIWHLSTADTNYPEKEKT
ncbi:Uncharacterised protein [Mycobacteroides abscessus subsp. abscessus]|nr:Uncharacterised protein [Mycobacteroides abscessus subsp. abscessus]SHY07927.1 Uncharacterised protein [Mycobacteroides abscessus subsp. abscessus]SIC43537.1 Uncharacterised protein [Mycobacteroides abscessus subsp. abscessus]SID66009.1 Uncharacterised protein [Mycobacteroides abscessus subsp. abscessus]SIF02419.1 Uncharacterised protein [Mycobacteroides abscessus subsp. abscessus]